MNEKEAVARIVQFSGDLDSDLKKLEANEISKDALTIEREFRIAKMVSAGYNETYTLLVENGGLRKYPVLTTCIAPVDFEKRIEILEEKLATLFSQRH